MQQSSPINIRITENLHTLKKIFLRIYISNLPKISLKSRTDCRFDNCFRKDVASAVFFSTLPSKHQRYKETEELG